MSVIRTLKFGTSLDLSGFQAGSRSLVVQGDTLAARVGKSFKAIELKPPEIKAGPASQLGGGSGAGQAEGAESLAAAIVPIASQIRSALNSALAPLNGFAARFGAQFDAVGGTILALARRIDEHLKFPAFERGIGQLRGLVQSQFAKMEEGPRKWAQAVDRYLLGGLQGWNRLSHFLANIGDITRKGAGEFGRIKAPVLNFDQSTRSVNVFRGAVNQAKSSVRSLGFEVLAALGLFGAGYKAVQFFKDSIKGASDLNETLSKTNGILGSAAPAVTAFADQMASKFGLVKRETLDAAAGFAGLGKGLGKLDGAPLAKFTIESTQLMADLVSSANISGPEAAKALSIAFSGEISDQLKRMGVIVNEGAVKQYALAHGLKAVNGELTEQQKLTARVGIVRDTFASLNITGDLARTADQTANAYRRLAGTITNLSTEIGGALMPAVNTAISVLSSGLAPIAAAFTSNRPAVEGFAASLASGFRKVGDLVAHVKPELMALGSTISGAFGSAGSAIGGALPSFEGFAQGVKGALATINAGLSGFLGFLGGIPAWIDQAFGEGAASSVGKFAAQFGGLTAVSSVLLGGITLVGGAVGGLIATVGVVPLAIAAVGSAVLAVIGQFIDWGEVLDLVGFAARNAGNIFQIAMLEAGSRINYLVDAIGLIPTNLGRIADYVKGNWFELMTLPLKTVGKLLASLGKSFWEVLTNPAGGFHFDFDGILKDFKAAAAKFPELARPEMAKIGGEVAALQDKISADEAAHRARTAKGPVITPPPAKAATSGPVAAAKAQAEIAPGLGEFAKTLKDGLKTPFEKYREETGKASQAFAAGLIDRETFRRSRVASRAELDGGGPKFAGAVKLGSTEAYSAILAGLTSNSGPKRLEDIEREHLAISREGNRLQAEQIVILKKRDNSLVEI
jgi:phage-related protein